MTIEIVQPELEALIRQKMDSGAFRNVEDLLMRALKSLHERPERDFADSLVSSPLRGSGLVLEPAKDYPRPVEF